MKVFDLKSLYTARDMAKEAVRIGTAGDGDYDWECAMLSLKTALGYCTVDQYESLVFIREQVEFLRGQVDEGIPGQE